MDVGFDTIGNAILIAYDRGPVLVTDPWITGDAYFGSWTFSHEIPAEQLQAIRKCRFVWFSHGHPDHLSSKSLDLLRDKKILMPDHVGGRISQSLRESGFDVRVLPDRTWQPLTDRIRVLTIADYNQDAILLVDINGRLVVDLNDANDRGWGGFVQSEVRRYPKSFLLKLSGFGDADMINFFDEQGRRIAPRAAQRPKLGEGIAQMMRFYGTRYFVPFSSMHKYQRSDSIWAAEYTTRLSEYALGFDPKAGELLPAFIRYDCHSDRYERLNPPEKTAVLRDPKEFGDDWKEELSAQDAQAARAYFKSISNLKKHFDFINLCVGGKETTIELSGKKFNAGITFEAPRRSLMLGVRYQIFDDLLIGNFMKTTLHGKQGQMKLYPDFSPYVAKYADNGRAKSEKELREYFREYRSRAPWAYLRHHFEREAIGTFRSFFYMDSAVYRLAKRAYHAVKGL